MSNLYLCDKCNNIAEIYSNNYESICLSCSAKTDWDKVIPTLNGHLCEGLKLFHLSHKSGMATLSVDRGVITTDEYFHEENPILLEWCPFCGTKLI